MWCCYMYSLQSIAKPSLVYTLLHWKPLSLASQAILVFSPLKPKIRGRCQVSSYLLVTVSFFFYLFFKIKEMGTLVRYLYLPQDVSTRGNVTKGFSPNHTSVCMQSGYTGKRCLAEGLISVLCKDFSNSVTSYTPFYPGK